ncbi:unnamed protein product [Rotaria sp. Silwood2]|nr:unnamed protein product [Rotaria sp. Silwood2]
MACATNKETDSYRDDVSNISSMSTTGTASTATSPPPYSSLLFLNAASEVVEQIINYLELEDNDKKDEIISDLLTNGRQALYKHQKDIIPELLSQEKEYKVEDGSSLLKIIKQYITETWERLLVNQPTIISFISDTKKENSIHFDNVLTRIAEYGSNHANASFILSFVLQLLSESIDDECFLKTNTYKELWNSITIQGIQGIKTASRHVPAEELEQHINNKKSPVYLALRMYYEEEIKILFGKLKIPNRKNTLYDLASDTITENGWLQGIQSIKAKITETHYDMLTKSIESRIQNQYSTVSDQVPTIQNTGACNVSVAPVNEILSSGLLNSNQNVANTNFEHSMDTTHNHPIATIQNDPATVTTNTSVNAVTNLSSLEEIENKTSSQKTIETIMAKTNDFNEEIDIIMKCKKQNYLTLENLVEAGELIYVNKTLKEISNDFIHSINKDKPNLAKFIEECQIPIMFLLKRQQNLDDFISILTNIFEDAKSDQSLSTGFKLNLRRFLHILLLNSDTFLSRIIMSLISKRNPVPFVEPNIKFWNMNDGNNIAKYEFISSIIHIWDHTRPTILSFGIGNDCQGKSTLLNVLFQSTFEQSERSIYFQETIDIDFGYSFNPERQLNIADCHGEMSIELLTKIRPLFDGYLIHINKMYLEKYPKTVIEYLQLIPRNKFYFIFVRDINHSSNASEIQNQCQKLIDSSDSINTRRLSICPLINMSNTTDREIQRILQRLRNQILKSVDDQKENLVDNEIFQNCIEKLLNKNYISYLHETDNIIQPLKKRLLSKNSDDPDQNNFPLYLKFIKLCELRQELKKIDFYGSKGENKFDINNSICLLENQSSPDYDTVGYVFQNFIQILGSDHMLMSLNLLSSELRQISLSQGGDKLANNLSVARSFLSLEVIWRNAIVCYKHASSSDQNKILRCYIEYIKAGFPFEIIDGDHFYFQHEFLSEVMKSFEKTRILVISIIGPQNSGKSTLLNYMFGTLFEVREGRCTRGIYGSFVKCNSIPGIDYILLIDTEGLLSIEKSDKEYDRRLVLFSLAISHLMIVNMLGDVNETLKDMLTLCTDSLKQLNVGKVPKPTVHFVLNQKADPNIKNHLEAINKIVSDLKDQDLAETISIGTDTFHTLPSAFKRERLSNDTSGPCLLRTEPDFIELTQKLVLKIIRSAKECYDRGETSNFTPRQWLTTSTTIFAMLQRFPDLTYFKDINEKHQDDKIRKQIEQLLSKTLSSTDRQKLIEEHSDKNEQDIKGSFQSKFQDHQQNLREELENIFLLENASERIRDRCQQFLERQVNEILNAWCTAAVQASDQKQMGLLVRDGAADLKKLIDAIIEKGETITKSEATIRFENMWDEKVKFIKAKFIPEERLKQAIKFVYGNYNIFERISLPGVDYFLMEKLPIIKQLIEPQSLLDLKSMLRIHFSNDVMRLQERVISKPNDSNSTLSTIENFTFLHKQILYDKSYSMIEEQIRWNTTTDEHKRNLLQRSFDKFKKWLSGNKSNTGETEPVNIHVKQNMRQIIMSEIKEDPFHQTNTLQLTVFFDKIYTQLFNLIYDQNIMRPVEIDIIQKIVGVINAIIKEINLELSVFELSLSKNISSAIHSNVVLLLTVLHFNEQKCHFDNQLQTLEHKKPGLLNFFHSMVVPNASTDTEGGEIFVNQFLQTITEVLTDKAYQIIASTVQTQQNLTRKELQMICDGKLQTANENWILKYIKKPTDIIVEEFKIKWTDIEKVIEQQICAEKSRLQKLLYDFFEIIRPMSTALTGKGGALQFIHDLFTSSAGDADENLKNKGQCMMLLFYAYLTNEKIELQKSYTVFNSTYTITPKGVQFFQNLLHPNASLAKLIAQMKTKSTVTSIKSFHQFLESILKVEQKAHERYNKLSTAFASYDKDKVYIRLLDKARGCTATCMF